AGGGACGEDRRQARVPSRLVHLSSRVCRVSWSGRRDHLPGIAALVVTQRSLNKEGDRRANEYCVAGRFWCASGAILPEAQEPPQQERRILSGSAGWSAPDD